MAWDANVISVWTRANAGARGEDSVNGYDMSIGGSPTYSTTDVKYGTKWTNAGNSNIFFYIAFGGAFFSYADDLAEYTIEGWWQVPELGAGNRWDTPFALGYYSDWSFLISVSTDASPNKSYCWLDGAGGFVDTVLPAAGTWVYWQVERTGAQHKYYLNGSLIQTLNKNINGFSTYSTRWMMSGAVYTDATIYMRGYLDRTIFSNTARGGVETVEIPPPAITSITPAVSNLAGGVSATIDGTGFTADTTIAIGGAACSSVVYVGPTEMTCVTPTTLSAGVYDVVATNTIGSGTLTNGFEVIAPSLTSLTPTSGTVFGGTNVTITGAYLYGTPTVTFGGTPATSVVLAGPTSITCVTPEHAVGVVDVAVTINPTITLSGAFTYYLPELYKPAREYSVTLNGLDITLAQKRPFIQTDELNIIEKYDIGFSSVTADCPLELINAVNFNIENVIKVLKGDKCIYIGNLESADFLFTKKSLALNSSPFVSYLAKKEGIFDEGAKNPTAHIYNLLTDYKNQYYSVEKFTALKALINDINVSIDTNAAYKNIMQLILALCELSHIGLYLSEQTIKAFAVPASWRNDAFDIAKYIITPPDYKQRSDVFADKIILDYLNEHGGTAKTITAGTGSKERKISFSDIYFTDAVAEEIAERQLAILSKNYFAGVMTSRKDLPLNIADYYKYTYSGQTFINIITKKTLNAASADIESIAIRL